MTESAVIVSDEDLSNNSDDATAAQPPLKLSTEEMLAAIAEFVAGGVTAKRKRDIYRVYKSIQKPNRKSGADITTGLIQRVNPTPIKNWSPMDPEFSKVFLMGLLERKACRSASAVVEGNNQKFFSALMISEIRGSQGIKQRDHASARETLCRVLEEATATKESDAAFADAVLPEPQVARQSVPWMTHSTGAGLLFCDASESLLNVAIAAVQARLVEA